jgi:(R,R)-butanediol dehydrogenase/meso-butanediol dehydrogenase/diacetyl reductase
VYWTQQLEVAVGEPEVTAGTVREGRLQRHLRHRLHEYYAGPIFVPTEPHPLTGQQMPLTMGHEFSGHRRRGSGVTDYAAGDRVAIMPLYRCGHCGRRAGNTTSANSRIPRPDVRRRDGGVPVVPIDMLHRLPTTCAPNPCSGRSVAYTRRRRQPSTTSMVPAQTDGIGPGPRCAA